MAANAPGPQAGVSPRVWAVTAVPVLLLLLASVLLSVWIFRMNQSSAWVEHSDEMLTLCANIERQIQRTQAERLQVQLLAGTGEVVNYPSEAVRTAFDTAFRRIEDNAAQRQQLALVRSRYEVWEQSTRGGFSEPVKTLGVVAASGLLNSVLEGFTEFQQEEHRLRADRIQKVEQLKALWLYGALPLLLASALAIAYNARRQILRLVLEFNQALAGQSEANERIDAKRWVRDVLRGLAVKRGESELGALSKRLLRDLVNASGAQVGAFYVKEGRQLKLTAGLGLSNLAPTTIEEGEGAAGVAIADLKPTLITDLTLEQLRVESAVVSADVVVTALVPCHHSERVLGLIELGFLRGINQRTRQLIELLGETVGTSLVIVEDQERMAGLLLESRIQAEALQSQQEELRTTNEELGAQTEAAKIAHAELEERKQLIETANLELLRQRDALARAQQALQQRAVDLGRADRYKSEFLASMSHELRTPLNSILILADALGENKSRNLTGQQVKFAQTIGSSGRDLLTLINDVLDLSKIEAGAMEFEVAAASIEEIVKPVIRIMEPLARERGLQLSTPTDCPRLTLDTDVRRVQQVLKNLLSNACKFTPKGTVGLSVDADDRVIRFVVEDTGIGIAPEDRDLIFEAFRQGEGAANRRFSGTGLGLSISRDLARKLDGDVTVESELGKGSRFILTLPRVSTLESAKRRNVEVALHSASVPDVTLGAVLREELPVVLLVTDNLNLVQQVSEAVRDVGFECVTANSVEAGVALVENTDALAVVVDLALNTAKASEVLAALQRSPATVHLPRHVLNSKHGEAWVAGAANYLENCDPATLRSALSDPAVLPEGIRSLLLVLRPSVPSTDASLPHRESEELAIPPQSSRAPAWVSVVHSGREGLELCRSRSFDCVVVEAELPDMLGVEFLRAVKSSSGSLPHTVVLASALPLLGNEEPELDQVSDVIVVRGPRPLERLVDEVTIFLETINRELSTRPATVPPSQVADNELFQGKTILLVDDDVRNVFALTRVLEGIGIRVVVARNGFEAIAISERRDDLALILMDVMMPGMDGLEATRRIRKLDAQLARVPIIALTAKAMANDREACLDAGASEYIAKPVDTERLIALMRIWLQGTA